LPTCAAPSEVTARGLLSAGGASSLAGPRCHEDCGRLPAVWRNSADATGGGSVVGFEKRENEFAGRMIPGRCALRMFASLFFEPFLEKVARSVTSARY